MIFPAIHSTVIPYNILHNEKRMLVNNHGDNLVDEQLLSINEIKSDSEVRTL